MMTPENYLSHGGPKPIDEEEIKEAVRQLLMSSSPPALLRVIGRTAFQACAPFPLKSNSIPRQPPQETFC